MKFRTEKTIEVDEWDKLVTQTYGRPYHFQQQGGCRDRGSFRLSVPSEVDEEMPDTVPEIVNHDEMGVNFAAWLARDPKQVLQGDDDASRTEQWCIDLWWTRNFYPPLQAVANDLHAKGLLEAGDYVIDIDW